MSCTAVQSRMTIDPRLCSQELLCVFHFFILASSRCFSRFGIQCIPNWVTPTCRKTALRGKSLLRRHFCLPVDEGVGVRAVFMDFCLRFSCLWSLILGFRSSALGSTLLG